MFEKYTFHSDPAHGWLAVPLAELAKLGIANQISGYSYADGVYAYLEEDCDLSTFINAKQRIGEWPSFDEMTIVLHYDESCYIRNMNHYPTSGEKR